MKAALLKNVRELVVDDVPLPAVGADEVLVKVVTCGICGTDLHLYKNGALNPNQKMGHESAGTIADVGADVKGFRVGERVAVLGRIPCGQCHWCKRGRHHICPFRADIRGGFAEYIAVKEGMLARIPERMTFREAACMEPMAVSVHGVRLAQITADDGVVITGAGPIGLFAAAYLRHVGVRGLVVSEPGKHRREAAARWADRLVNPLTEDVGDAAREVLDPGADAFIECSGNAAVLEEAFQVMQFAGRMLMLGTCLQNVSINPAMMLVREIAVHASYGCDMQEVRDCIDLVGSGRIDIKPIISGAVSLEALPDAFERLCKENNEIKLLMEIA
jgi:2-desacetyl-2-hydroxyethyl bacteriochlorophyllide A dehydrogenase